MSHERNVVNIFFGDNKGMRVIFNLLYILAPSNFVLDYTQRHSIVLFVMKRVKIIHNIICEGN